MEMAIDAAGFSAAEADKLRQAMGSKRSAARMERLRVRLFEGMAERGITGPIAEEIWEKLRAFANFGFPESHSVSFAYLVYVSAWLKLYYPASFLAALLNSQPMGFWAPHSLVADARRHGVSVLGPDVNRSAAGASLEGPLPEQSEQPRAPGEGPVVRLGIASVKGIGDDLAKRIAEGRPYESLEDLALRTGANKAVLESLATAGAVSDLSRREALWVAGAAAEAREDRLPGTILGTSTPHLPPMDEVEEMAADLQTLGLSPRSSPMVLLRSELDRRGAVPISSLMDVPNGQRVTIAGIVTHRQRPATAGGTTIFNVEDETGLVNVICSPGLWVAYRKVARSAIVMLVRGRLERAEGAHPLAASGANLIGEYLEDVDCSLAMTRSRDFH